MSIARIKKIGFALVLATIAIGFAHGDDSAPKKYIEVYDPSYPSNAFQSVPNSVVRFHTHKSDQRLPTPQERDSSFAKVDGLPQTVKGWNELQKDLLYMRAKHLSTEDLVKNYPKIERKSLLALSHQLHK